MRLWIRSIVIGLLALILAAPAAAEVKLEAVDPATNGIGAALKAWHDDELARQDGKFKSHGWWPWGLRAFDFDNDGDLDLMPSHHGTPRAIILKNLLIETGKLTFTNVTKELGIDHRDLPIADDRPWIWDFDGDGFLDIAGISDESKPGSFFNLGGKKLEVIANFTFNPVSHPHAIGDYSGDGYIDLDGGSRGHFLYDPKARTFKRVKTPLPTAAGEVPAEIVAAMAELKKLKTNRFFRPAYHTQCFGGRDTPRFSPIPIDLNGDGRGDMVVQGSGGYGATYVGRYLLAGEDGKLTDQTKALGLPETGAPLFVDDLTGDGRPEILIAGKETGGLYINDGRGRFARRPGTLSTFLTRRGPYLLRAFRCDLDNDSDWDLVMSNPRGARAEIYENAGDGAFTRLVKAGAWDANPIVIGDINNDGLQDVIIGGPGGHKSTAITIYLNRTAKPGHSALVLPRMAKPNVNAVGAVVTIYKPGELDKPGAVPLCIEGAHPDATPVHIGLAGAKTFDLRIKFPNGKTVTHKSVPADKPLKVTPEGKPESVTPAKRGGGNVE